MFVENKSIEIIMTHAVIIVFLFDFFLNVTRKRPPQALHFLTPQLFNSFPKKESLFPQYGHFIYSPYII